MLETSTLEGRKFTIDQRDCQMGIRARQTCLLVRSLSSPHFRDTIVSHLCTEKRSFTRGRESSLLLVSSRDRHGGPLKRDFTSLARKSVHGQTRPEELQTPLSKGEVVLSSVLLVFPRTQVRQGRERTSCALPKSILWPCLSLDLFFLYIRRDSSFWDTVSQCIAIALSSVHSRPRHSVKGM